MKDETKRKLRFLAGFGVFFATIWLLWDTGVVYPLKIFVVLLHELSHGLAAVATGGSIDRIVLTPDQGGACYCFGGNAFLTLSAGYLGSLAWGAVILEAARLPGSGARWVTASLGLLVTTLTVLFVRTPFGVAFGIAFGIALCAAARFLPTAANAALLTALGLTSCLYAILDIKSDILDRPELRSDARMLAEATGVPTLAWGVLWIGTALGVSWLLFRRAWRTA